MTAPATICPNCGAAIAPVRDLPPTRRQWQVLEFVYVFIKAKGYAPSLSEIAAGLDRSAKSGVRDIVHGLKQRGLLDFEPHRARTLSLTEAGLKYATRYQT